MTLWFLDDRGIGTKADGYGGYGWLEIHPEEAVEAAFRRRDESRPIHPGEFMNWLRGNLNSLAQGVLGEHVVPDEGNQQRTTDDFDNKRNLQGSD